MKEIKCCELCGEEFTVKGEAEDCFECQRCRKNNEAMDEDEYDSSTRGGR